MLISSFVEMGGILRFDSHLLDTETGQLVAVLSVSGLKDDYADLVEKLARQVTTALSVPVPTAEERAVKAEAPTESWEAYTYLGRAMYYRSVEQPQKPLEEVLRCLYLEPYCVKALHWALFITDDLDTVDLTVQLAERIIGRYSLDPDKRWLVGTAYAMMYWNEAATIFIRQNRMDEAISVALQATQTPPEPEESWWGSFVEMLEKLLVYSLEKDDLESARKIVEATIQKFPRSASTTAWGPLNLARVYEAEGKLDQAIQSYSTVAELRYWDSFFGAMWQLGDLYVRKGDVQQGLQAYQRIMRSAAASRYQNERQLAAQAAERLKELGMSVPVLPEGYKPILYSRKRLVMPL